MSQQFQLVSDYRPTGDQPAAIEGLVKGVRWVGGETITDVAIPFR